MRQRSNQARSGVSLARTKSCSRHEEANHEQGYGQEEGSEEEAGKVSAGEARAKREKKQSEDFRSEGFAPVVPDLSAATRARETPRPPQKRHIGQVGSLQGSAFRAQSREGCSRALWHYLG